LLHNPFFILFCCINRDVEFKEEEAWDGSINKIVSGEGEISLEDYDGDEKAI
jgi:hypothetical protein